MRALSRLLLPRIAGLLAVFLVLFCGAVAPARAAGEELLNTKVYFPHTKSYFELVDGVPPDTPPSLREVYRYNWGQAEKEAKRRSFKGVRGRLAVVRDRTTHDFLRQTFWPRMETWIGLRYICSVRRLLWVDGKVHKRKDFSVWSQVWNVAGTDRLNNPKRSYCGTGSGGYLPIHYWAETFRWNANGPLKEYHRFFVEYVTAEE